MRRQVLLVALLAIVPLGEARGGLFFHGRKGTPPPGRPRQIEHTPARAGDPLEVSPHAVPSNSPAYAGYQVGGGSPYFGGPRRLDEGTWGWDYVGTHIPRNVGLRWNHGRHEQGGTGAYRTDR